MVFESKAGDIITLFAACVLRRENITCVFSTCVSMKLDRGLHLIKPLPLTISELSISRTFFITSQFDGSFLDVAASEWPECQSYKTACKLVNNLPCVDDCAEHGVMLMQNFNATIANNEEKQFVLQVVEKHRRAFPKCHRQDLADMSFIYKRIN